MTDRWTKRQMKSRLHGIGYTLMQKGTEDKPQLLMCGSRSLTAKQANYATAELKALSVLYACQSCRHQLQSIDTFGVRSTYRPLQGLFQRKMHKMGNERIIRIREKLAEYRFNIEWANKKQNKIAETLFRAPTFQAIEEELINQRSHTLPRSNNNNGITNSKQ